MSNMKRHLEDLICDISNKTGLTEEQVWGLYEKFCDFTTPEKTFEDTFRSYCKLHKDMGFFEKEED